LSSYDRNKRRLPENVPLTGIWGYRSRCRRHRAETPKKLRKRGMGSWCRKLPQRGPGRSLGRKRIWYIFTLKYGVVAFSCYVVNGQMKMLIRLLLSHTYDLFVGSMCNRGKNSRVGRIVSELRPIPLCPHPFATVEKSGTAASFGSLKSDAQTISSVSLSNLLFLQLSICYFCASVGTKSEVNGNGKHIMGIGGNMSINCIAVDLQSLPIVAFMDRSVTHHAE